MAKTHHRWRDLRAERDDQPGIEERRARAKGDLEAEAALFNATLAGLRRARKLTQTQLARALDVSQAQVSRIEHQADLYLSTLRSYVEAMGGKLELVAMFEDARVAVDIEDLPEWGGFDSGQESRDDAVVGQSTEWEVVVTLEYRGDLQDRRITELRNAILHCPLVTGDTVLIQRGRYRDLIDVGFQVSAQDADDAKGVASRVVSAAMRTAQLTVNDFRPTVRRKLSRR